MLARRRKSEEKGKQLKETSQPNSKPSTTAKAVLTTLVATIMMPKAAMGQKIVSFVSIDKHVDLT